MQVRSQPVAAQRGLVMIMTLVMLAVMTVGAAVAVRMSVTTDMVGANLRARSLAFQTAEAVLRYCEEQVISNPYTTRMLVGFRAEQEWNDDRLWEKGGPRAGSGVPVRAAMWAAMMGVSARDSGCSWTVGRRQSSSGRLTARHSGQSSECW